jgi:hypothetical protein
VIIATIDSNSPDEKNAQAIPAAAFTFLSTKLPPKAADIPKKKMASEKANSIFET